MPTSSSSSSAREEALTFLHAFHKASATLDAAHYAQTQFTRDAVLHYANFPAVSGRANIEATFAAFFAGLESMVHEVTHFDIVNTRLYQQCTITYTIKNDPSQEKITIPAIAVFHRRREGEGEAEEDEAGKVWLFEVYLDPSPFLKRVEEVRALTGACS